LDRVIVLLQNLGFSLYEPELSGENLIKGLREFQEHLGGQLTIMLLERLGKGVEVHEMDHAMIEEAVKMLKDWNQEAISKS
jgi:3-dehydroquinate synthase